MKQIINISDVVYDAENSATTFNVVKSFVKEDGTSAGQETSQGTLPGQASNDSIVEFVRDSKIETEVTVDVESAEEINAQAEADAAARAADEAEAEAAAKAQAEADAEAAAAAEAQAQADAAAQADAEAQG